MRNLDINRALPPAVSLAADVLTPVCAWSRASAEDGQTIQGEIDPASKLSVPGTLTLRSSGSPAFPAFTGSATINYKVRTTPTGGPSASAGGLTCSCSSSTLGANCSGTQTAGTSSATPALTISSSSCTGGGSLCSSSEPNTMQVNFTLSNLTANRTINFSAQVTFSISAT